MTDLTNPRVIAAIVRAQSDTWTGVQWRRLADRIDTAYEKTIYLGAIAVPVINGGAMIVHVCADPDRRVQYGVHPSGYFTAGPGSRLLTCTKVLR